LFVSFVQLLFSSFSMSPRPPTSTLFPYTTLFRSEINELRLELKDHPCHACSEKDQHMRWADRYWKLKKDTEKARRAIRGRTNTIDRKSTRLNSSHVKISYAVFCLKKKNKKHQNSR